MKFDRLFGALVFSLVGSLCAAPHVLAASPSSPSPASSPTDTWRLVGPKHVKGGGDVGRINTFAFDPTQPNTVYAASPFGGLWRTQDSGATWQLLHDFRPNGLQEIAVDPAMPSTLYALTGDGDGHAGDPVAPPSIGVAKSTDGGKTWSETGLKFAAADSVYGYRLAIDPHNSQILLAATSMGLYRTENGGQAWSRVTSGFPPTDLPVVDQKTGKEVLSPTFFDVQFHPTDPQIVYAASQTQVYRSNNAGQSWTLLKGGLPLYNNICNGHLMDYCSSSNPNYSDRIRLAVTPASPDTLYVLYGSPNGMTIGLFRSDNQGGTFTKRSSTTPPVANGPAPINLTSPNVFGRVDNDFASQSSYDIAMAVSPTNADIVYVGGVDTWRSTNGGRNWARTSFWDKPDTNYYTHADIHSLGYRSGSSPAVVYVASDGGIYRSTSDPDATSPIINWESVTKMQTAAVTGITIAQTYHVCASQQQPDQLYYGAQDLGTFALDFNTGNIGWVSGGDGYVCQVDPQNPKTLYVNTDSLISRIDDATNAVWPKDQAVFASASPVVGGQPLMYPTTAPWVVPYIFGPPPGYGLYACYKDVWRSLDQGRSWVNLTNGAVGPSVQCAEVAVSPADPKVSTKTIYIAKNAVDPINASNARTAQRLSALPPMLGGFGVFRSTDGGATWRQINGSGANTLPLAQGVQITDLAVSPIDPNRVWVAFSTYGNNPISNSAYKVFSTTDGGAHWTDVSNGLPKVHSAFSLAAAGGASHGVYVGTDAGVYYRDDTLSAWTKFKTGLPSVAVYALLLQEPQHRLLAATYGRGIWTVDLSSR